jgi:hypothetical protein
MESAQVTALDQLQRFGTREANAIGDMAAPQLLERDAIGVSGIRVKRNAS